MSNVDLTATFMELGRTPPDGGHDGVSLVGALEDPDADGPTYAYFEHTQPATRGQVAARDPDRGIGEGGTSTVPSYQAVRAEDALLVRYRLEGRYAWEYYRYRAGEDGMVERVNTYRRDRDTAQLQDMKARADCYYLTLITETGSA